MSALNRPYSPPFDEAPKQSARSRAIELLPKLEAHTWQDDHFRSSSSGSKLDIIAVFDHNVDHFKQTRRQVVAVMMVIFMALCALIFLSVRGHFRDFVATGGAQSDVSPVFYLWDSILWTLQGLVIGVVVSECLQSLPHTAVTSGSVIYVDCYKRTYVFPLNDIVALIPPAKKWSTYFNVKLLQETSFYREPRPERQTDKATKDFIMDFPADPGLFLKLVLALKQEYCDAPNKEEAPLVP